MKQKKRLAVTLSLGCTIPAVMMAVMGMTKGDPNAIPSRPEGPCDIYATDGAPCVAAHSSTRALYAAYNGPLYQVMRKSDGKTLDIGVVQPSEGDPGGYADAAAQDAFCKDTYCWITVLYDQSGNENHLEQAPRGAFIGPAMGGFNNLPIADMAPVTVMGHKVYGIFIAPDMGLRLNDTKGIAVDDQAEGQYWVINGHHFNDGCCFDYGNAETDSRDDGDGTMETTYYGNANLWYYGQDEGPWIMTDQENNLVGCVNPSPDDKYCEDLPSINWRFVTATADGEPGRWRMMGGNAQEGALQTYFDGPRIINDRNSYDPMRKQGAIVLGNGGDNNNYSQGTFYEAAMTAPGTFPSEEAYQKIQANIVAAGYEVASVAIAPSSAVNTPPGLQTFVPESTENTTVSFTNTTGSIVEDLKLSIVAPDGWKAQVLGSDQPSKVFEGAIAPGETVSAIFNVTSDSESFNGDLLGQASWTHSASGKMLSETAVEKVRNVSPIKINEFQIGSGENFTNSFIELYNASQSEVDLSDWVLTQHATQLPIFTTLEIPEGTKLAANDFYLFALSTSGLAVSSKQGDSTLYVSSTTGLSVGDEIEIGQGASKEIRKIKSISNPAPKEAPTQRWFFGRRPPLDPGVATTLWQPLPEGPVITIPKGSTNIPVESVDNFEVGQKMAIGYGATYPTVAQSIEKYEVVTVTEVGQPGRQAWLSMDAKAGDTVIKVSDVETISVGDKIRLDIESEGYGVEWVTVKAVGTASSRSTFMGPLTDEDDPGTGLELEEPLKFDHASNMPFASQGTGISFEPATKFDHSSNEPVLALCYAITLDQPLEKDHEMHTVIMDEIVTTAGYQGNREPDQWFGGPVMDYRSGNMVLTDAEGNVVDSLNYGELVDPWASEGYQGISGAKEFGCYTPSPGVPGGSSRSDPKPAHLADISSGRYPDGTDYDSNCSDFKVPYTTTLACPSETGSNNVKVNTVDGFKIGQKVHVGVGDNREPVIITAVGTPGGTFTSAAIEAGATVIPVQKIEGFNAGQMILVGTGENQEKAIVASTTRRWFWPGTKHDDGPTIFITTTSPLVNQHGVDEQVAGSGITFSSLLNQSHESGAFIAGHLPTPGAPNQY